MRALLHLGILALVVGATTSADAQGRRRSPAARQTTVVVDTRRLPPPRYDWRPARVHPSRRAARLDVQRQRRDHEEIVRIAHRWRQASYSGDHEAKRRLKRRANVWIDREIAESQVRPHGGHDAARLMALQHELNTRYRHHSHRHAHGRWSGAERKARVLDELVVLSALDLQRAESRALWYERPVYSVR